MKDNVNHPEHYNQYRIEVWDLVELFDYNTGNVLKYLLRAPFKNPEPTEDLRKARSYIEHILTDNGGKHTRATVKAKTIAKYFRADLEAQGLSIYGEALWRFIEDDSLQLMDECIEDILEGEPVDGLIEDVVEAENNAEIRDQY